MFNIIWTIWMGLLHLNVIIGKTTMLPVRVMRGVCNM